MSNVKEGDWAQVIGATKNFEWTLGRVVQIASACPCFSRVCVSWRFEEPLRNGSAIVKCAPDRFLKRIPPLTEPEHIINVEELELSK